MPNTKKTTKGKGTPSKTARIAGFREVSSQYPTMAKIHDGKGGYRVELTGDIKYVRHPSPGSGFQGCNLQLSFPNQEETFWADAQVWESALEAVTGLIEITPADGEPTQKRIHAGLRVGDRIKVTGYAGLKDPLRKEDGSLVKYKKQPVRQLRIRVNYASQIEVIHRVRGCSNGPAPADSARPYGETVPDALF